MGNSIFNPGNEKYHRKVIVLSIYSCTAIAAAVTMQDHGKQEHLFSPIQRYLFRKFDSYYAIQEHEIQTAHSRIIEKKSKKKTTADKGNESSIVK
jgi:hypothetical protein